MHLALPTRDPRKLVPGRQVFHFLILPCNWKLDAAVHGENTMKYTLYITLRSLKAGMVRLIRLQGLSIGKVSCPKSCYWRYICLWFCWVMCFFFSCCLITVTTKAVQRCPEDCKALELQFQQRFLALLAEFTFTQLSHAFTIRAICFRSFSRCTQ